eukprot:766748-Hanusia_phi.AAC.8
MQMHDVSECQVLSEQLVLPTDMLMLDEENPNSLPTTVITGVVGNPTSSTGMTLSMSGVCQSSSHRTDSRPRSGPRLPLRTGNGRLWEKW